VTPFPVKREKQRAEQQQQQQQQQQQSRAEHTHRSRAEQSYPPTKKIWFSRLIVTLWFRPAPDTHTPYAGLSVMTAAHATNPSSRAPHN
jgi:hypothetical protein